MGRPALTEEQKAQARRRIVEEAHEIVKEGGFEAVSIRSVAARVGIAASGVYSHFESRDELLRTLCYEPIAAMVRRMVDRASSIEDPLARLGEIMTHYCEFALANPELYRAGFLGERPGANPPARREPLSKLRSHMLIEAAVREGQATGQIRAGDPSVLAQLVWTSMHGALALPENVKTWDYAPTETLLAGVRELVLAGLKAPGAKENAPDRSEQRLQRVRPGSPDG